MTDRELMQQALDYLERHAVIDGAPLRDALRERLAQPEQEPDQRFVNLLCRIHRDGGHYIAEHGFDKAVADADIKVAELNSMSDTRPQAREPLTFSKLCEIEEAITDKMETFLLCDLPEPSKPPTASRRTHEDRN